MLSLVSFWCRTFFLPLLLSPHLNLSEQIGLELSPWVLTLQNNTIIAELGSGQSVKEIS